MTQAHSLEVRVLILEDSKYWQGILSEIVLAVGFTPRPAQDLPAARKLLETERIDIVVTDVFLEEARKKVPPKGLWLLRDVRELHQKANEGPYVIVLSGSSQMGLGELQMISTDYREIVIGFLSKDTFSESRMEDLLREAAKKKQEAVFDSQDQMTFENDVLSYGIEAQPWHISEFPAAKEIDSHQARTFTDKIDVVLITANDEEIKAILHLLRPFPRRRSILKAFVGPETYYLGKFGAHRAVVTKCRMGSIDAGSVILATEQAQRVWQPKAVIMVGTAFGKDPKTQAIADVLVASQIISYEQQRVGGEIIFRGPIIPGNPTLLNRFVNVLNWHFERPDGKVCKIRTGAILSGEKLVDNPNFKAELFNQYPQAIGGEMEGAGLSAAALRAGTAWILVKSICDWGDGKKHKKHQPLAAAAAASLVHHVLSQKMALKSLNKPTS